MSKKTPYDPAGDEVAAAALVDPGHGLFEVLARKLNAVEHYRLRLWLEEERRAAAEAEWDRQKDRVTAADELLAALKELLPHAERDVAALNQQMVGSLYPAINLAKLARARDLIAKAEDGAK